MDRSENTNALPAVHVTGQPGENGETLTTVEGLPKELGVLLVVSGIGGLLLPGPVGTPFLLMGGVILWPAGFRRVDRYVEKRFPRLHREGMTQMARFVRDLERRYPWT